MLEDDTPMLLSVVNRAETLVATRSAFGCGFAG
jgi:hypothetical protein